MVEYKKKCMCAFMALSVLIFSMFAPMFVNAEETSQQTGNVNAQSIIQSLQNTLGSEYADDYSSIGDLGNVSGIKDLKNVAEQITNDEAIQTGWAGVKEALKKVWDFIVHVWNTYIKPYAIRYPIYAVIVVVVILLLIRSRRRRY